MNEEKLANGLGWFSIGLGLAEVLSPRGVSKLIGVRGDHNTLLRVFGLREIASGVGILTQKRPAAWVWSRVAGDALDLACLGMALASKDSKKGRVVAATANVLGVTLLDVLCAQQLQMTPEEAAKQRITHVNESITVNGSPDEVYRFWRNFENLPRFMKHLESVTVMGDNRSHWVARAPAGTTVEWDAEITADEPGSFISWRSLNGADVDNSGSVRFERATGGRGTIVRVEFEYEPPAGLLGATVAKLFGEEPTQQVRDDLRRFKQVMETGEVVVSHATVAGTGLMEQQPAQP